MPLRLLAFAAASSSSCGVAAVRALHRLRVPARAALASPRRGCASPPSPPPARRPPSCWSCGVVVATTSPLACASCDVPLEVAADDDGLPAPRSHFAALALAPSLDLSPAALADAARAAQRRVHPDRFAGAAHGARARAAAADASARVNAAARALRSPLSRAQHLCDLLRAEGEAAGGAAATTDDAAPPPPPPALLLAVFAAREALADPSTTAAELRALGADAADRLAAALGDARAAFAARDVRAAAAATVAMRYWSGLAVAVEDAAAARGLPPTPAAAAVAQFGDGAGGRDV